MKRTLTALLCGAATMPASAGAHAELITLRDITQAIVPTSNPIGDREFGGNGPRMTIGLELTIERGGRAIFAYVTFTARELGGDGSYTEIGPVPFQVWRWEDEPCLRRVVAINSQQFSLTSHDSRPGCGFGCAQIASPGQSIEDGGVVMNVTPDNPGPVSTIRLLGDTSGDDISTDSNPSGDTSIRAILFNQIDVTFEESALCS